MDSSPSADRRAVLERWRRTAGSRDHATTDRTAIQEIDQMRSTPRSADDRSPRARLFVLGAILLSAATTTILSACNTTEGVGRDVKAAGQGIENAAERNK